jgi:hypothetical protein
MNALGDILVEYVPHPDFMKLNFKLLQAVVAMPKDARAVVTIPAGTVVEVLPTLRKGRITEVLWEGECFCAPLDDLLGACPRDDLRKVRATEQSRVRHLSASSHVCYSKVAPLPKARR